MLKKIKLNYQTLKSGVINLVIFAVIFNAVSFYRELNLLPSDSSVTAPNLSLPQVGGQMFSHQSLAGKNTVVYFFAPWCNVCHLSIGNLENLYQDKKGDINVIAVALSYDSHNEVQAFVQDKDLSFPVLMGTNELMSEYQINGFPSYYVLDEQGMIRAKSQGYSTELGLRLRALL